MSSKTKAACTLAEVLITLAIIGVIASMTIPSLLNSAGDSEIVTRVKRAQFFVNEAIKLYEIDNGCIGDLSNCSAFSGEQDAAKAWSELGKYFNVAKYCGFGTGCFYNGKYKYLSGSDWENVNTFSHWSVGVKAMLADGTSITLRDDEGNCTKDQSKSAGNLAPYNKSCGIYYVDVNGLKGPNQLGRDTFTWIITATGAFPTGGHNQNWTDDNGNPLCDKNGISPANQGDACTAKVLQDGAINY